MSNHETERARLTSVYSKMSDDELAQIVADEKSLTDIAKTVLEAELSSRGIERNQFAASAAAELPPQQQPAEAVGAPQYSGPLAMVKRFRDLPEAVVAKSILDSAEIDSFPRRRKYRAARLVLFEPRRRRKVNGAPGRSGRSHPVVGPGNSFGQ